MPFRFSASLFPRVHPFHPNPHGHSVAWRLSLWVVVTDSEGEIKENRFCFWQKNLPVNEDCACTFAPRRVDSDCLFRSTSVNHLQNCVSASCFVRSPPTLWHRLHRLTENLERNLLATLLPKGNAASFWQTHNGFLWRLRFSRRSHFNDQNRMSLFLVPRPPSFAPFRKCMDWVMGVMSTFASNNYKLQNLVAFWRQIKILRVRTYDFPAVNNLKLNLPTQSLISSVVKVNSDRDWGFQL
ncbi:MAG: hypothetical protein NZ937_06315 [Armatimonadetes bacterium]|nr:hypothetical protein [Armatimonadota bacterium]